MDASDPTHEAQLEVSRGVLREIGADAVPSRLVLNKTGPGGRRRTRRPRWKNIQTRSRCPPTPPGDVSALRDTIIAFFEAEMIEETLVLPYAKQGLLGEVYETARVLSESYDESGRVLHVRGLPGAITRLRRSLAA